MSRNKSESQTSERPEYHFSLPWHQIFAPSGLIYIKGIYHLFILKKSIYSSDPKLEWSHLQSKDLLNWTNEHIIPLDHRGGEFYSGYIVYDQKNSSNLGSTSKPPLIALFNLGDSQSQFHLQYSKDNGITWTIYGKVPVLDIKKYNCRDPYIFWHESTGKWIMLISIANEYKVLIYASKNLIRWELISDFGGHPSFNKKWSHASMIPCRSKSLTAITKWILMIGVTEGEYSNRYFVGEFDGKSFKCDHALDALLKIDAGKDFSSPRVCHLPGDHGNLIVGQMSHLAYEDALPTFGWKGMLTAPREVSIIKEADGTYRLVQHLPGSWTSLRSKTYEFQKSSSTNEVEWDLPLSDAMEFDLKIDSHKGCTIEFDFGSKTKLLIQWDVLHHQLSIDRTGKNLAFHPSYSSLDHANLSISHILSIRILLDKYSMELFADGGKVSLTSLFFSPHRLQRFRILGKLFSAAGTVWSLKNVPVS